ANLGLAAAGLAHEGQLGAVGGDAGRVGDGVEVGALLLVAAVVVHGPDLLAAAAVADEGNLGGGDAGTEAEGGDDVVGELVGDGAGTGRGGGIGVAAPEEAAGAGGLGDVVEVAVHQQAAAAQLDGAKRQALDGERRARPGGSDGGVVHITFGGNRRRGV